MSFAEKWLAAVDEKNSVLCAGLDPADYAMGHKRGLPQGTNKRDWTLKYVEAVAPYAAALKPNSQYWKSPGSLVSRNPILYTPGDREIVFEAAALARSKGLVVIDDSKLADIGETNDAGVHQASLFADAVTGAPFAGNLKNLTEQGKKRGVGIISMCLMSNPEYEREKNKLIPLSEEESALFSRSHIAYVENVPHIKQYIWLARMADEYKAAGLVIGAPSADNHIKDNELLNAGVYSGQVADSGILVLLPGVGAQGGEASAIWKYFHRNNVIVNVGRALMFPDGLTQAEAGAYYQNALNELRQRAA